MKKLFSVVLCFSLLLTTIAPMQAAQDISVGVKVDVGDNLNKQMERINTNNLMRAAFFMSLSGYIGYHFFDLVTNGIVGLWNVIVDKHGKEKRWAEYQKARPEIEGLERIGMELSEQSLKLINSWDNAQAKGELQNISMQELYTGLNAKIIVNS